jgi:hypothetical protein
MAKNPAEVVQQIPENLKEMFWYVLNKPGRYNSYAIIQEITNTNFNKILKLKTIFNKHEEWGYKITGSGLYDPNNEYPTNWIEFIIN